MRSWPSFALPRRLDELTPAALTTLIARHPPGVREVEVAEAVAGLRTLELV